MNTESPVSRGPGSCWMVLLAAAAFVVVPESVRGANQIALGRAGGNAGATAVAIDVLLQNDTPIHAFSVAFVFDPQVFSLDDVVVDGTELAPLQPDFFYPTIDNTAGTGVLGVILAYTDDPFAAVELPASPDTLRRVSVLHFTIAPGAPPGEYVVALRNRVGDPPVSNVFSRAGQTIVPTLADGLLTVNNQNILSIGSVNTRVGAQFDAVALGRHPATLQGFSIGFTIDKSILTFVSSTYLGTAVAAAIAPQRIEFFQPEVDANFSVDRARVSIGAVLDFAPPFTGHEIPASAAKDQSMVRIALKATNDPTLVGTSTQLTLHEGGEGKVNNIFIIDKQSFTPALNHGLVNFTTEPLYRRGFANADQRIDISDGIYMLLYLFLGGDEPQCTAAGDINDDNRFDLSDAISLFNYLFAGGRTPAEPFLSCGVDPTPGTLTCLQPPECN